MKNALPLLAAAAISLTACVNERVYLDPNQNVDLVGGIFSEPAHLNVFDGSLRGDFGPRRGFDGVAEAVEAYSDEAMEASTVTIARTEPGRGTGMVILWTQGTLLEDLAPGAHKYRFDPNALEILPVGVNVCSGPDVFNIDYDLPADEVDVVVTPTPEGRVFEVHTETAVVDPATGERTGALETSSSTFVLGSSR